MILLLDIISRKISADFDRSVTLETAGQDINRQRLIQAGIRYVTTEDHQMARKAHLIVLPDGFDVRAENAVEKARVADYKTICGESIFLNDNKYSNVMFSEGFGSGVAGCMTCIAKAGKHL